MNRSTQLPAYMETMIDLHTHSTESDGSDIPARIPELAAAAQCSAVSLTDHDTLTGINQARDRATELGVEFIPGCEVSCLFGKKSAHVLVYFIEDGDGPFQDELVSLRQRRVERNREMTLRLKAMGLPITYEEIVLEAASEESVGRPHFAKVLVRHGAASTISEAFDNWLGEGRPGYIQKDRLSPSQVASLARNSGGVAVLAHPLTLQLEKGALNSAVAELAKCGFAGIEAIYSRYSPEERIGLMELARRHDLVATGGSDHHGTIKPDITVGTGAGDLKVPDSVLERLAARRP